MRTTSVFQTPEQVSKQRRLPPIRVSPSKSGVRCKSVDNTTADVLGEFPGNTNLTFCGIDACQHCVGGYSNRTYCTLLWTRDPFLKFEPLVQSDFMVGVKWNVAATGNQSFSAKVCASEGNCYMRCFEERVDSGSGQFLVPTDLWRFRLTVHVRRFDGTTLYQKNFRSKRLAPDRPCFSTGVVKSWSEIWLYWWPQDDTCDGYLVSWCRDASLWAAHDSSRQHSNCTMDVSGSSVALRHLKAFSRYVFSMRAYRWLDANRTERLFSRPLKSQSIVLINPSFIPVFVLVAIPAVSVIVSVVLILANIVLRRDVPSPRLNRPRDQPRRNATYQRPPQLPPIVLRRHSRGDFE
ncbi:uncharacterized protein LOC115328660 [Ixodes scapularis]|uniref:uncharacterized protein LOC115328660 n=1 Tax=Ixodes scapularis TaxID=6945 RepID=UPI001AD69592|nr:uncharacterized protein LOC115328660 [Ixodes scapularis]